MVMLALLLLLTALSGCTVHLLPLAVTPTPTPTRLGRVVEYPINTLQLGPLGITAGPDGAVWFAGSFSVGRITPTGAISTFPLPHSAGPSGRVHPLPNSITLGPDGALWFADRGTDQIGRITPAGVVTEFALSPPYTAYPQDITAGHDGALWFTRATESTIGSGDAIGRITPTGTITTFPLPAGSFAWRITAGPDGALWFTVSGPSGPSGAIGRITPSGAISEFPIPYPHSGSPWGIVAGPDHALWFTDGVGPLLGRVTASGAFTDLGVTNNQVGEAPGPRYDPREIVVGPDEDLWFTEPGIYSIGHFVFAPPSAHAVTTVPPRRVPH
jgi:virginiamycin B lyase